MICDLSLDKYAEETLQYGNDYNSTKRAGFPKLFVLLLRISATSDISHTVFKRSCIYSKEVAEPDGFRYREIEVEQ